MKRLFLILCLTLFVAIPAFAQFPAWGPQSRIVTDSIQSKVLGKSVAYNVFLPKSFDAQPQKHYPILYLLHGVMDTNAGWTNRGHLKDVMDILTDSGEAVEMVIVTPNAGGNIQAGDWNGYFNMEGWAYEDFFYTEFLPTIEEKYRAGGSKGSRAIAGLSMGGGGTTSYAQLHSDMFCAAYAMSALMENPGPIDPNDKSLWGILSRSVKEHSCIEYVKNATPEQVEQLKSVVWFVDCGDDDFLLNRNIEFYQAMKSKNIPCQFRVRDGGHTWEYWHSALYTALPFVSRNFNK